MNKTDFRDYCDISSSTLSKLSKNECVSMNTLSKICSKLNCNIEDVIKHVSNDYTESDIVNNNLRFIDLFSGIGGFRVAAEENGMKCVFSSEIDGPARQVYFDNFGDIPSGDITKIHASSIPDFDVLFAGFPCQPFSYSGKLAGFEDEARGTLFFDVARILKEKQPEMFLLENVKGLKSHDKGRTLEIILQELDALGYTTYWDILNSLDYGVPQSRERWYCVGFKNDIDFSFPKPLGKIVTVKDILIDSEDDNPELRLPDDELALIDYHFSVCPANSPIQIRVEHDNSKYNPKTKKGKYGIFSYLKPDGSLRFHVGDYAKTQIQELYYCSETSFSPAIIATRSPKVLERRRKLSSIECARLQGFNDDFIINSSVTQTTRQLGNAITVPVVSMIIKSMVYYYNKNTLAYKQLSFLKE